MSPSRPNIRKHCIIPVTACSWFLVRSSVVDRCSDRKCCNERTSSETVAAAEVFEVARQGRLFTIDTKILQALYEYSHQSGDRLDALYDEALRDLLKKKGQPVKLTEATQPNERSGGAHDP